MKISHHNVSIVSLCIICVIIMMDGCKIYTTLSGGVKGKRPYPRNNLPLWLMKVCNGRLFVERTPSLLKSIIMSWNISSLLRRAEEDRVEESEEVLSLCCAIASVTWHLPQHSLSGISFITHNSSA